MYTTTTTTQQQLMSESKVSGGFWCSIQNDIKDFYGVDKKGGREDPLGQFWMICHDQEDRELDSFW